VVLDLGSTDGTLEILKEISAKNPRVVLHQGEFNREDAGAFADAANECISLCAHDNVLFYQADEVPHENLLRIAAAKFEQGQYDLSFWRYQLQENFQLLKWFPHVVHRVGTKGRFEFVVDGMNTERMWDAKLCYENYNGGWFTRWGASFSDDGCRLAEMPDDVPERMPTHEMILDVGKSGAFRDTIRARAEQHFPFWSDDWPNVDGERLDIWWEREKDNPNWDKEGTAFDIPKIMRYHLGKPIYELRTDLLVALCEDQTKEWIQTCK